jgi:hypothetical protein
MLRGPRGKLINFPGFIPDLEELPEGTLLEPGMEIRFRGRVWCVDDACHCEDVDEEYSDVPTLVDSDGVRYCLLCGEISGAEELMEIGGAWIPDDIRDRMRSELGLE